MSQTTVLNDLFSPMSTKRAKDLGLGEEDLARYVNRLSREVEASGATDKIAVGLYLTCILRHTRLTAVVRSFRMLRTLYHITETRCQLEQIFEGERVAVHIRPLLRRDALGARMGPPSVSPLHVGSSLPALPGTREPEGRTAEGRLGGGHLASFPAHTYVSR